MSKRDELALVEKAIRVHGDIGGCLVWTEDGFRIALGNPALQGLNPTYIRRQLIRHVRQGGRVIQKKENAPEWADYEFSYRVIVPEPGFKHGIFVEMRLHTIPCNFPVVEIVSAHPQLK